MVILATTLFNLVIQRGCGGPHILGISQRGFDSLFKRPLDSISLVLGKFRLEERVLELFLFNPPLPLLYTILGNVLQIGYLSCTGLGAPTPLLYGGGFNVASGGLNYMSLFSSPLDFRPNLTKNIIPKNTKN